MISFEFFTIIIPQHKYLLIFFCEKKRIALISVLKIQKTFYLNRDRINVKITKFYVKILKKCNYVFQKHQCVKITNNSNYASLNTV